MSTSNTAPFKKMFLEAVDANMREASNDFNTAWQICQITHRGTWQAFQKESALIKAANEAAELPPQVAATLKAEAAAKFKGLVEKRMSDTGDSFDSAWLFMAQTEPKLYSLQYGVTTDATV